MTVQHTDGLAAAAADAFAAYTLGDPTRLSDLVELLTPLLWNVARAQRLDRDDAADVVQSAWVRLVEKADTIREPKAVLGWLVVTVRHDAWRVVKRRARTILDDRVGTTHEDLPKTGTTAPADPADVVVTATGNETLWHHIQSLSPRCRELLRVIAFVDRPDYATLSQALGMPVGSIGPTRGRCLASLRKALLADPTWSDHA